MGREKPEHNTASICNLYGELGDLGFNEGNVVIKVQVNTIPVLSDGTLYESEESLPIPGLNKVPNPTAEQIVDCIRDFSSRKTPEFSRLHLKDSDASHSLCRGVNFFFLRRTVCLARGDKPPPPTPEAILNSIYKEFHQSINYPFDDSKTITAQILINGGIAYSLDENGETRVIRKSNVR